MKDLLNRLFEHKTLSRQEAKAALLEIGHGQHNTSQISSFLTVFIMRHITVPELQGFRDAMIELSIKIDMSEYNAIDIVGTGGDGKNTFNISTASALVVAGAGIKVTKHGNYGASSVSGSSNVLELLGVKFSNEEDKLKEMVDKAGFCMLHAPLFHPAMKHVGPIRKELQVRTFFNMLGPMINPTSPKNQFLGVFNLDIARLYGYVYQDLDANYKIIHALDGYDEISLTSPARVMSNEGESLMSPADFGFEKIEQSEIFGGETIDDAAKILTNILGNQATTAQKNVVLANAGMAIQCIKPELSLQDSIAMADESITSGAAKNVLETLRTL